MMRVTYAVWCVHVICVLCVTRVMCTRDCVIYMCCATRTCAVCVACMCAVCVACTCAVCVARTCSACVWRGQGCGRGPWAQLPGLRSSPHTLSGAEVSLLLSWSQCQVQAQGISQRLEFDPETVF